MKTMKKVPTIILAMIMILFLFSSAAQAEEKTANANMNFDVMFAIDASGSMLYSDPGNLRMTAGRLFTDLAASDTSRVGYVQFTNSILSSAGLTDLSTEESKNTFRNTLSTLPAAPADLDDTDISLGLAEALRLLKEGNAFDGDRKPVIILLSDGNTDLPYGPRTVAESEAQLVTVLNEAASLSVPIYSLGLNYGETGEIEKMQQNLQNIAAQTNGTFYNVTTAQEFSKYMTQIFDDLSDGGFTNLNPAYENGRYTASFVIDNSSVLSANIVILTDKGVSDPKLYRPGDNGAEEEVPLNAENNVIVTTDVDVNNSSYMVLKVMYPKQGTWKVSVAGSAEDAIEIKLLTTYDLAFVLDAKEAMVGDSVEIKGALYRADQQIVDADLLDGSQAFCTIVDNKGTVVEENVPMTYDGTNSRYTYTTSFENSGNYYITANLKGKDDSFKKDSAQFKLSVNRVPITVEGSVNKTMWCSPIKVKGSFQLEDVVSCEAVNELVCQVKEGGNLVQTDYDNAAGKVTLTPMKTGAETIVFLLSDNYGQSAEVTVFVKVNPSWILIVLVLVLLAVITLVIALVIKTSKPKLTEPVTIELGMPAQLRSMTPSATTLSMPAKTSKVNLLELIQKDPLAQSVLMGPIMQAGLLPIAGKIDLIASGKGITSVKILPKVQGILQIDNQNVNLAKGCVRVLKMNEKLGIQYSTDGMNISTIYLSLGNENDGFGQNGPFGSGFENSPFGDPFGGNTFGSPFGAGNNFGGSGFGTAGGNTFGGSGFGTAGGNNFGGSGFGNAGAGNNFGGSGFGAPETGNDFNGNSADSRDFGFNEPVQEKNFGESNMNHHTEVPNHPETPNTPANHNNSLNHNDPVNHNTSVNHNNPVNNNLSNQNGTGKSSNRGFDFGGGNADDPSGSNSGFGGFF